ncbi:MAG TPA: DUF2892 domain-containing protein [Phycisphaerales bacterium]|nr:DUF2892 domain-containing protein [Phycisphaerales bacterium]
MNEGPADRVIRVIVGLALAAVAWFMLGLGDGEILGIVAVAVGAILFLTGVTGFCPAYKLVGLSTCPLKRNKD